MADIVRELLAHRSSPDQVEARLERRARRTGAVYDALRDAVSGASDAPPLHERLGYSSWNMKEDHSHDDEAWVPIGRMHPAAAAVDLVRDTLGQFEIAALARYRYEGMHRESGKGMHSIQDGVIDVGVELKPAAGRTEHISVPVYVQAGRMLRPGIAFVEGLPQILAQSLFDQVLTKTDLDRRQTPDRGMFDPPGGGHRVEQLRWASAFERRAYQGPSREDIRDAILGVAGVRRQAEPNEPREQPPASEPWSWESAPSPWGPPPEGPRPPEDPAQSDRDDLVLGARVRTTQELEGMAVGSPHLYVVPAGTAGVIVKDIDGTGRRFQVRLEQGSDVVVPGSALARR